MLAFGIRNSIVLLFIQDTMSARTVEHVWTCARIIRVRVCQDSRGGTVIRVYKLQVHCYVYTSNTLHSSCVYYIITNRPQSDPKSYLLASTGKDLYKSHNSIHISNPPNFDSDNPMQSWKWILADRLFLFRKQRKHRKTRFRYYIINNWFDNQFSSLQTRPSRCCMFTESNTKQNIVSNTMIIWALNIKRTLKNLIWTIWCSQQLRHLHAMRHNIIVQWIHSNKQFVACLQI